jgi:hypothetical protein
MTFEELISICRQLATPRDADTRRVEWVGQSRAIGFALQPDGATEIFLKGEALPPQSAIVQRHVQWDTWRGSSGTFRATRVVLPPDDHYRPVAALIVEELFRHEAETNLLRAFRAVEPILEMALRRLAASDDVIVGLIGELRVLGYLLNAAPTPSSKGIVLESWGGHRQQSRDFVAGQVAIEVKTTTRPSSVHRISRITQVDPDRDDTGQPVEKLYLVSIGLSPPADPSDPAATISLPQSVDDVLLLVGPSTEPHERTELQSLLLIRIRNYLSAGYDHDTMRAWPAYQNKYSLAFTRIYDMADPNVQVLRLADARRYSAVNENSVAYEIALPDQVTGDLNPQLDVPSFARKVVSTIVASNCGHTS